MASGRIVGRDHAVKRRNCQDACAAGVEGEAAFGVVSDGCGEGAASEVGAALTCAVAVEALRRSLAEGVPFDALPSIVLGAITAAMTPLASAASDPAAPSRFIRDHLLATLVAFVVSDEQAIVFACGDGVLMVDGEVLVFDEDNRPSYLGYLLTGRSIEPRVHRFGRVDRIAVATDGVGAADLAGIVRTHRADLTRALRVEQHRGALEDDGAVASATRRRAAATTIGLEPAEGA